MSNKATAECSDNFASGEQNAPAIDAPRVAVVTDYSAVPAMISELQRIHDLPIPRQRKRILAVLALLGIICRGSEGNPKAAKQLLDLLPSTGAKHLQDMLRGMVAAAVAWLRAAEIDEVDELDKLLKTNEEPFVLGFKGANARRWFYDVKETLAGKGKRASSITIDVFRLMAPDPSLSPTQDEAKGRALEILHSVRLVNPKPLMGGD